MEHKSSNFSEIVGSCVAMMTRAALWRCSRIVVMRDDVKTSAEGIFLSRNLCASSRVTMRPGLILLAVMALCGA
jgi:hypothetical protein